MIELVLRTDGVGEWENGLGVPGHEWLTPVLDISTREKANGINRFILIMPRILSARELFYYSLVHDFYTK